MAALRSLSVKRHDRGMGLSVCGSWAVAAVRPPGAASVCGEDGRAEPFAPNGRRFREWGSIPGRFSRTWPALVDEALRSSAERRSVPRAPGARTTMRNESARGRGACALERVRSIALALPEVNERLSHGEPCFFVRDRRPLCYFHDDHNGDGRISLWCPSPPGVQEELVSAEPVRFFKPPTSARGTFADWLGVYLDTARPNAVDWNEVAAIVEEAYRNVAPTSLTAELANRRKARPHSISVDS